MSARQMTIDEQLTRLEQEIRRLKIEFDVFFNGGTKRPPYDTKYRVEALVKQLFDERGTTFAQRFRYNSLVARYNAFRELWRRNLKEREECAREAPRSRTSGPLAPQPSGPLVRVDPDTGAIRATVRCSDPASEPEAVEQLYESFIMGKVLCGEPNEGLTFERFSRQLAVQTQKIKDRLRCETVEFVVEVKDAVQLRARAV